MRDPVARQRPVINLDEFERRLRQPAPQAPAANDDPLAELARLVGDDKDPYQQMFQEHAEQERAEARLQRNFKGTGDTGRQAPPPASRAVRTEPRLDMRQDARQDIRPEMRREPRTPQPQASQPQPRDHWPQQPTRPEPAKRPPSPVQAPAPRPAPRIEPERAARPAQRPAMPPAPSIAQIRAQQQAPAPVRPVNPAPQVRQPLQRPAPQAPASRNLGGDFATIEAGLRGSIEPNFRTVPPQSRQNDYRGQQNYQIPTPRREPVDYRPEADYRTQADYRSQADYQADYRRQQPQQPQWDDEDEADYRDVDYRQQYQPEPADDDDDDWLDMHDQAPAARPMPASRSVPATMREPVRSRRLVYMTAAVVLIGMGGIGVVFASKHDLGSPHQIAMIKASTNPAKVQAPNDSSNTAMQDDSVFDKTPQPPPGGVANHEEQPVDLAQTSANANTQQGSDNGNASTIPVPTPPSEMPPWQQDPALDQMRANARAQQQQQQQPQQQAAPNPDNSANGANPGTQVADSTNQAFGLGGTIQSKKVKTLAVRPDGSVVADSANNNNDNAVDPNAMQMPAAAQGSEPAPQGGDGANGANPNTTAQTTATDNANGADQQPTNGANDASDTDNGPSPVRPHHVKPMRVVDLGTGAGDDTASSSGDFAVQLAAPGSEAEAHRVMTKLAQDYQGELGDHKLKFRRAKVGDKSIYRVRVGGLSKTEATSLCEALQAKGGTCFVAKD